MKKHLITLILGFILIGIGSIVTAYELMDYQFINKGYYSETSMKEGFKKIKINNSYECIKISVPEIDDEKNYKIIYDRELTDEVVINYKYLSGVYDINVIEIDKFSKCREIRVEYSVENFNFRIRTIVDDIINNLKEKKIYNYTKDLHSEIEIIVNPAYEDVIRIK
jgi:hypothetical protein